MSRTWGGGRIQLYFEASFKVGQSKQLPLVDDKAGQDLVLGLGGHMVVVDSSYMGRHARDIYIYFFDKKKGGG